MTDLCVVIPVYNEERSIERVLTEWLNELRPLCADFKLLVINDGSTDGSLELITRRSQTEAEITVVDKANSGHGPSCIYGYHAAIKDGAEWIFQIDSDGQCDPANFKRFWQTRQQDAVVQGFRRTRDDGLIRTLITKLLSLIVFVLSGDFILDLNVPYRLMHRSTLEDALNLIPNNFRMANILLTYIYQRRYRIIWLPINFRERFAGASKTNVPNMGKAAYEFVQQFNAVKRQIDQEQKS